MIGPVFFVLLETSIRKGVRAALAFDMGVFISDLIYIGLAYLFYAQVAKLTSGENSYILKFFGGIVFVCFGSITLLKKPKGNIDEENESINQTKDYIVLGLKGFFLNFANPMVIFYWFSVIALGAEKSDDGGLGDHILLYIIILITTFFTIDFLKIVGAKKLRPFITDRLLLVLNRINGLILLIFGIVLFLQGLVNFM